MNYAGVRRLISCQQDITFFLLSNHQLDLSYIIVCTSSVIVVKNVRVLVGALRPFGLDCKQRHYAAQACFSGVSADLASLAVRRCDPLLLGSAHYSAQFSRRDL